VPCDSTESRPDALARGLSQDRERDMTGNPVTTFSIQLGSGRSPDQGHADGSLSATDRRVVTPVNGARLRKICGIAISRIERHVVAFVDRTSSISLSTWHATIFLAAWADFLSANFGRNKLVAP
jgi:hypothetical protein